jgi:hypothetical protein
MLGGAVAVALAPKQVRAEEEEVDDRYDENGVLKSSMLLKGQVVFQTVPLDGSSSYQVPEGWKVRAPSTATHATKGGALLALAPGRWRRSVAFEADVGCEVGGRQ